MKLSRILLVLLPLIIFCVPFYSYADNGISNFKFDVFPGVAPKIYPVDGHIPVSIDLTIDAFKFATNCGDQTTKSFRWSVYQDNLLLMTVDDTSLARNSTGEILFGSVNPFIKNISVSVAAHQPADGVQSVSFRAIIECGNANSFGAHKNVSESAPVAVDVGTGSFNYACVVPVTSSTGYGYSCSQGNKSDCSDVVNGATQCGTTCAPVKSSFCGKAAPKPDSGTSGTGSGTGTGSGSTVPSTSPRSYTFGITNPLNGSANTLMDIFNIASKWILNISIPIAVILILYAGFKMLTAGAIPSAYGDAKKILQYTILGLSIILIGRGFITLIYSILNLGTVAPTTTTQSATPTPPPLCVNGKCSSKSSVPNQLCSIDAECSAGKLPGGICTNGSACKSNLRCVKGNTFSVCQFPGGNLIDAPCDGDANCQAGLYCDKRSTQNIDGVDLGFCLQND